MAHLIIGIFGATDVGGIGMWLFLTVGAVVLFAVFIPLLTWMENRRKEREAFYKAETFRRLAESSAEGAKAAIDLLREENRQKELRKREGMKIGGLINIGVGAGLVVFVRSIGGANSPYLCGLLPGLIGVAMLIYVYLLAAPVE
jgi:Flp pilus assembly protein TadB